MVSHPRLHGEGNAQRLMRPAEAQELLFSEPASRSHGR